MGEEAVAEDLEAAKEEAEEVADLIAVADMEVAEEADLEEAHSKAVFYIHSSRLPKILSCHVLKAAFFQNVLKQSPFSHSSTQEIFSTPNLLLYAFTHAN